MINDYSCLSTTHPKAPQHIANSLEFCLFEARSRYTRRRKKIVAERVKKRKRIHNVIVYKGHVVGDFQNMTYDCHYSDS